ncbi:MAG: Na/Pi cotransporter family protein [archaeon]
MVPIPMLVVSIAVHDILYCGQLVFFCGLCIQNAHEIVLDRNHLLDGQYLNLRVTKKGHPDSGLDLLTVAFDIVGGLALFLYGMVIISSGLQKTAGQKTRLILEKMTDNPIKGIATGIVTTVSVQSSSVITVFLVTMVNSQLLTLRNAVGVIFGANIGTTITAQMIAFNIGLYALPVIAVGFLVNFLGRNPFEKYFGEALLGVGFIFLGMIFMNSGVKPLHDSTFFMQMLKVFGDQPIWGIISGAIFTGIIQASSATIALVIAMAMQGMIDLQAAIAITMGANIGTCVTALIGSIGTSRNAKRVAVIHLSFNVIGTAIMFFPLKYVVQFVSLTASDLPRQIANAHTIFNILTTVFLLPFISGLILLSRKIVRGEDFSLGTIGYLDRKMLKVPSIAIEQATKEIKRMADITFDMLSQSKEILFQNKRDRIKVIEKQEITLDQIHHSLDSYLLQLSETDISSRERERLAGLTHSITDIERVGDLVYNIAGIGSTKVQEGHRFSPTAMKELRRMFDETEQMYVKSIDAFLREDEPLAAKVVDTDTLIDSLEEEYMNNHLERLRRETCSPKAGILFVDLLRNLERIGDHANNIGNSVIFGF